MLYGSHVTNYCVIPLAQSLEKSGDMVTGRRRGGATKVYFVVIGDEDDITLGDTKQRGRQTIEDS